MASFLSAMQVGEKPATR